MHKISLFGKISLFAPLFFSLLPFLKEKMKKKVFNTLKFGSLSGANYKIVISGAIAQLGER